MAQLPSEPCPVILSREDSEKLASLPVSLKDVQQAAVRVKGIAKVTPVFTSDTLNSLVGRQLHVKAESLQKGGAFKFVLDLLLIASQYHTTEFEVQRMHVRSCLRRMHQRPLSSRIVPEIMHKHWHWLLENLASPPISSCPRMPQLLKSKEFLTMGPT